MYFFGYLIDYKDEYTLDGQSLSKECHYIYTALVTYHIVQVAYIHILCKISDLTYNLRSVCVSLNNLEDKDVAAQYMLAVWSKEPVSDLMLDSGRMQVGYFYGIIDVSPSIELLNV